jgi:hypothetical protein
LGLLSPSRPASWSNSGQAFQILDQPDHRQRIPVTVVEQVSPDSVSFVLVSGAELRAIMAAPDGARAPRVDGSEGCPRSYSQVTRLAPKKFR